MRKILATLIMTGMVLSQATAEARLSPTRTVLDNGLVVITSQQPALPMVTMSLLIESGSRLDPAGREGAANLVAQLLTYGTKKRSAVEFSDALDFLGATISTGCSEEAVTANLTVLKKDLDAGLELLAEMLTEAAFPAEDIERQKQAVIATIRAQEEQPGHVAEVKFMEALYPKSPYGRQVEGTAESVKRIDRAALIDYYDNNIRPERAIVAVVGDVSEKEIAGKLTSAFQPWQKKTGAKAAGAAPTPGAPTVVKINKQLTQANIVLGHAGVPRTHPDYYAIQVMNYILGGGGFSARLMDSIRTERGFAYSVYSQFEPQKYTGSFQIVMQTKNESAAEAIKLAVAEMRKMREQGVTEAELNEAKDYLIGSFPLRFDTNRKVAAFLSQIEFYGLGLDYPDKYTEIIKKITQADVLRVAQTYLHPEKLITVVVADQSKAGLKSLDIGGGL
ncbi:MAG TPA: pitrilysin family protein [Candidatus Binatia bacterium]|nr:pitrilysin family protein [Candidatus Binatia bacterium]